MPITAQEILEWFSYDPNDGIVRWKKKPNRNIPIGRSVGFAWNDGTNHYTRTMLGGRYIFVHVVAFVCMTGEYPSGDVDHINGNGQDNRWINLRDVSHSVNGRNQKMNRRNRSGVMGVIFHKASQKWLARIALNGVEQHLGVFENKAQAISARKSAEQLYGYHPNHGRTA